MQRKDIFIGLVLCVLLLTSCSSPQQASADREFEVMIDSIRAKYAPDKRDELYEISINTEGDYTVIAGFTTVSAAKTELVEMIRTVRPKAMDSILLLPDENLGDKRFGVINVSVADLRTGADYDAEMATQLLLGMSVRLLQQDNWYRVRTSEGYIAWLDKGLFVRMSEEESRQWNEASKVIFTDDHGFGYESPKVGKQRVSDLVFGNLLAVDGEEGSFYRVRYPDGRKAYILKTQCQPYNRWLSSIEVSRESIVQEAMALKGIPYVWGGTSSKGMDCSGFVKTVYLRHGIALLRDASQQATAGAPVDISESYDALLAGDLLFFGRKASDRQKERIRHVAIYTGDKDFIHASGYIKINSLDSTKSNYDSVNTKELVRARRIIGSVGTRGIVNLADMTSY